MSSSMLSMEITPTALMEPVNEFQLKYILLITCAAIVLIFAIFLAIVLFIKLYKKKRSSRYVYETKPKKKRNGVRGSVFSVRSQGILELKPPPAQYENVNISNTPEESNLTVNGQQSQEEPSSDHAEVPMVAQVDDESDYDDVVFDELEDGTEELGNFSRHSAIRQSIRSDTGRSINFSRQSASRVSVRSESGITHRIQASDGSTSHFNRRQPTRMSTRSEAGILVHRDAYKKGKNSDAGIRNSSAGMQPLSIHQVHNESNNSDDQELVITSYRRDANPSPYGDIPAFKDPEIVGDSVNDDVEGLFISLPPNIYNSQILSTVKSPECDHLQEEDCDRENEELDRPLYITQSQKSTNSLDRFIPLVPDAEQVNRVQIQREEELDPRYSRVFIIDEKQQSLNENSEAVYDEPLPKNAAQSTKDNLLPGPIFDDPGYNKGFRNVPTDESNTEHFYHTLEVQPEAMKLDDGESDSMTRDEDSENQDVTQHRMIRSHPIVKTGKSKAVSYENVIMPTNKDLPSGHMTSLTTELDAKNAAGDDDQELSDQVISLNVDLLNPRSAKTTPRYENVDLGEQRTRGPFMQGSIDVLLDFQDEELEELDPDIASCLKGSSRDEI